MFAKRLVLIPARQSRIKHSKLWHIRSRQFSSSTSASTAQSPTHVSTLAAVTSELDKLSPRIDIQASQIHVLEGPKEFYTTLKDKLRNAKKRIYLATLYIGKTEYELMSCIREALAANSELRVSVLTDALRGTREDPSPSCASLLASLAAEFPHQVEIRMYHTPNLTGIKKRLIPKRINEGWGLQHMKIYGIDDEVILSGANLSDDYFTNRQDRYHLFSSTAVSGYFQRIFDTMCSVSLLLEPTGSAGAFDLVWPENNACKSPLDDPNGYSQATKKLFADFIQPLTSTTPTTNTSIYPLLIIPNALNNELPAIQSLLATPVPANSSWLFTAGYFNPHPMVTSSLLTASSGHVPVAGTVVTASPWANGFYGSKGISGMLPPAYTLLSRRFLKQARKQEAHVDFREWRLGTVGRPHGWTYHAKGLWLTFGNVLEQQDPSSEENPAGPSVTIIGSSNYTVRSYSLDTEVGAVIVTADSGLQARLKAEQDNLLKHTKSMTEEDLQGGERRVGLGVRIAMWIVTAVGGSL